MQEGRVGIESLDESQQAALVRRIMRRQAALSLRVAAVFVALLLGLPLANLYAPEAMNSRLLGFSLTWLVLAVLFYPVTWILSTYFVKASNEIEEAIAREEAK